MSHTLAYFDSRLNVNAIIQRDHQGFGEIQKTHTCTAVSPLARDRHFHTANRAVIIRIFRLHALRYKRRNDDFIVVKRRHAKPQAHNLDGFLHKVCWQILVITYS